MFLFHHRPILNSQMSLNDLLNKAGVCDGVQTGEQLILLSCHQGNPNLVFTTP